ncbi:N-terminal nucleophile aminohydrolase [Jaminaea rosea]|uniref:N-terminal nucleophile aminohydrolase n=1 Tax=Jaminaea rosea TaxID=1569628 RepID=A0A316UMT1_9BASI|nr:N-terminal nucleophile aminohydrolase [Jaminaea rosea]PWN26587.1 N-terminal nucleophile aminohydrolase [Jaminaea rosea]
MGIGFAGLTNDARVLSNWMRQLALSSRMTYSRPLPLSRVAGALADRAQLNTMEYGRRPYGVGFLVAGYDALGPHLYEFSPVGTCFEYYAMSLGARSQSAKTYLERRIDEYKEETDLDKVVMHGLYALRETLQQGKELEPASVSVAVVGPGSDGDVAPGTKPQKFRLVEGEELKRYLDKMEKRRNAANVNAPATAAAATAATGQPSAAETGAAGDSAGTATQGESGAQPGQQPGDGSGGDRMEE